MEVRDKGKPVEKRGRKANEANARVSAMPVGLPKNLRGNQDASLALLVLRS
jgi:hypothetical protein